MSTSARLNATAAWEGKYRTIRQAQSRRKIPREELAEMPKVDNASLRTYEKNPTGASAMVMCNNFSDDEAPELVDSSDEETYDDNENGKPLHLHH